MTDPVLVGETLKLELCTTVGWMLGDEVGMVDVKAKLGIQDDIAARKLLDDANTKNGDWDWIVWGSGCVQEILDVGSNGRKVGVG